MSNLSCPLCGAANDCAVARSGRFESPCWCTQLKFAPGVLGAVPSAQRGRACICAACAATGDAEGNAEETRIFPEN
ncbi:MAG: cysteine-rich CWC family protein [Burkholderiaceae bacterium]